MKKAGILATLEQIISLMLKYTTWDITFAEIPEETCLCFNLSNCPNKCSGCHSPELQTETGIPLTMNEIIPLLNKYSTVTCVVFMGGDSDLRQLNELIYNLKCFNKKVKIARYSGNTELPEIDDCQWLNYIKIGPYIKELGPLDNPTTNQRLYQITDKDFIDITDKFWK